MANAPFAARARMRPITGSPGAPSSTGAKGTFFFNEADGRLYIELSDGSFHQFDPSLTRCSQVAAETGIEVAQYTDPQRVWQAIAAYNIRNPLDLRDWPAITHPNPNTPSNYVWIGSGSALLRRVGDPNDVHLWHRYEGIAQTSASLPAGVTAGQTVYLFLCANSSGDPALATAFFSASSTGSTNRPAGYDWIKYVCSFTLNGAALISAFGPLLYESERDTAVPPGTILPFAGGTPPTGYMKMNGATIPRVNYANLWAIAQIEIAAGRGGGGWWGNGDGSTTFKIPDSRGKFLRSWDDGAGIDPGRVLGSGQNDQIRETTATDANGGTIYGAGSVINESVTKTNRTLNGTGTNSPYGSWIVISRGGAETRPINLAPLFIIKY